MRVTLLCIISSPVLVLLPDPAPESLSTRVPIHSGAPPLSAAWETAQLAEWWNRSQGICGWRDMARMDGSFGYKRRPVAVKINTNYLCKLCRDLPLPAHTVWNMNWGIEMPKWPPLPIHQTLSLIWGHWASHPSRSWLIEIDRFATERNSLARGNGYATLLRPVTSSVLRSWSCRPSPGQIPWVRDS